MTEQRDDDCCPPARDPRIAGHFDALTRERTAGGVLPPMVAVSEHLLSQLDDVAGVRPTVLELGCGTGELLAALKPSVGVGVDLSAEMIRLAGNRYPHLRWLVADAHDIELDEVFDFVILSDLVNDLWDVQRVLDRLKTVTTSRTRIVLNVYSRVWEPILAVAQQFGLSKISSGLLNH